jgi:hypothetical protein
MFDYAAGSPQEKAVKIFVDFQVSHGSWLVEIPEFTKQFRHTPVAVELMKDGWHVHYNGTTCDLFGRPSIVFGGTALLLDKDSLKILKVERGQ